MSEMVERVARVLWQQFATEGTYDEDRHDDRAAYLAAARAAIEALREPTEAMIFAGRTAWFHTDGTDADDVRDMYRAMLTEALK